jgi:hypothetical protein
MAATDLIDARVLSGYDCQTATLIVGGGIYDGDQQDDFNRSPSCAYWN